MNESEFNELIDELIMSIEEQLDDAETNIDYETSGGILSIIMENQSQIIINRQSNNFQLWLAAKSGGYHFEFDPLQQLWLDTKTTRNFIDVLNTCLLEQSGENLKLQLT